MADVNPQVQPVQDPNYLFWSRPIQQFEGNKSTGIALETAGTAVGEAIKGTDTAVKRGIDEGIRGDVESAQAQYETSLQSQDPIGNQPSNLLSSPQGQKPAQLDSLGGTLGVLNQARANGRLTETDFKGRLDQIAKDYRSRYPGYKDYIDETVRNSTGFRSTANEYIQSMIQDINAAQTKKDALSNHIRNELVSGTNIFPGTDHIVQQLDAGEITPYDAIKWLGQRKGQENAWKLDQAEWDHTKDQRAADGLRMQDKVSSRADDLASRYADNMFAPLSSVNKRKIFDLISEAGNPKSQGAQLSDQQWMSLDTSVQAAIFAARRDIHQMLNERNSEGASYTSIYGKAKADEVENGSISLLQQAHEAIMNKDSGLAFRHLHSTAAFGADFNNNVLKDHDMAAIAGFNHFLTTYGGPNALKDSVGVTLLTNSISDKVKQRFTFDRLKALSQNRGDPSEGAQPVTVKSLLDGAQQSGINDEGYNRGVVEMGPTDFLDPKYKDTPIQQNAARMMFDPSNEGAILRFNKDTVENGRHVPGYMHVFNTWYSPAMTEEAARVGKQHPEIWNMYRTSAEKTFGSVFSREINDLNRWQNFGDFVLHYDADTHHFSASVGDNQATNSQERMMKAYSHDPNVKTQLDDELARLNSGIDSMVGVAKHIPGFDPDIYMLNTLRQRGADLSKVNDVSGKVFQSISASKFADEGSDKGLSLEEWMKNPTRARPDAGMERRSDDPVEKPKIDQSSKDNPYLTNTEQGYNYRLQKGEINKKQDELQQDIRMLQHDPFYVTPPEVGVRTNPGTPAGFKSNNVYSDNSNLGDITGIKIDDIPEGMSPRDFIKQLQERQNDSGK